MRLHERVGRQVGTGGWARGRAGKFYLLLPFHVCASTAHMRELSFPLPAVFRLKGIGFRNLTRCPPCTRDGNSVLRAAGLNQEEANNGMCRGLIT